MDRSKKLDKQTLYEIYRACRICGAGAGYKMPIIQNLVQIDTEEVELKQKIRECLQLEVNSNDKMPPLICELCVDKLDEFYEFLTTCRQTNANTRKRLGLPLQDTPAPSKVTPAPTKVTPAPVKVTPPPTKVTPVSKKVISKDIGTETCMLGLIEASAVKQEIYIVSKRPDIKKAKNSKVKKEEIKPESPVKSENTPATKNPTLKDIKQNKEMKHLLGKDIKQNKEMKHLLGKDIKQGKDSKRKRETSPKRATRQNNSLDEAPLVKVQETPKNLPVNKPGPKSRKMETKEDPPPKPTRAKEKEDPPTKLTKKEDEPSKAKGKRDRDDEPLTKLKRAREKDVKTELTPPPAKKTKSTDPPKPPQPIKPQQKSSKSSPRPVQSTATASKTVQPDGVPCPACNAVLKSIVGLKNHMHYIHPVTWTPDNLACNACREWFPTIEESVAHHKKHTYYRCLRCKRKFRNGVLYHQHEVNNQCVPPSEVPDVKCAGCWRTFPTRPLMEEHRCLGPDGRPGGKCSKCNRNYALLKNLTKHESTCTSAKKVSVEREPVIESSVREMLVEMEVRIVKCDELLQYGPVVSACTVPHRFGLDRKMVYPYMPKLRVIKKPTFDKQDEVKEEFNTEDFNWADFEDIEIKTVKKLSTLCLKVIFSSKMLGELEILDEIDIARRSALRKRIESIIYKFDDASSTNSDSILDKNAIAKTFEVVNEKFGSEDKNYHSDSTVFDETTVPGKEGKGSDAKIDDFDKDFVDNHENSENLGADNDKIDNLRLNSSILSNTDIDIKNKCDTSIVNEKLPSNEHLELSKTLRDDVTSDLSGNLSAVNEEQLENNYVEVSKLKSVKNSTETANDENMRFDNIRSCNDSSYVINKENSTNDGDSPVGTESNEILAKNDEILSKNDVVSKEEPNDSVNEANNTLTNHDKLSNNYSNLTDNKSHTDSMEKDTEINNLDDNSVSNEDTTKNAQNSNSNDNDPKLHDDDRKTEVENMEIDETCRVNSINFENTNKISEYSDTESIGNISHNKINIESDQSVDSCTKIPENAMNLSPENHPSEDIVKNINEIETKSPQKANKSLDFSVTGILNHVTSKNMNADSKNVVANIENDNTVNINLGDTKRDTIAGNDDKINNTSLNTSIFNHVMSKNKEIDSKNIVPDIENDNTAIRHSESIKNDTNEDIIAENDDKINKDDCISFTADIENHVTSKNIETDLKNIVPDIENDNTTIKKSESIENDRKEDTIAENNDKINNDDYISFNKSLNDNNSVKNDSSSKNDDTLSLISTSSDKNDDAISVNSQYNIENLNKSDKFNVNELSEDERKLMAELDEQIGETNEKIDKLSDGRDLNLEFSDGYNFD